MTTSIESYTLSDGQSIPWLAWGYGTPFGKDVLEAGIRHIDTAQLYKTEEATGKVVRESVVDRKDIFVTSKRACHSLSTPHFELLDAEAVRT